jgi:large subunit ribosomal protein L25
MGTQYELTATLRQKVGKGAARAVRRQNEIPAVIYGNSKPPIAISLPEREIRLRIQAGGFYTTVANISVDGQKITTLPRDYQLHPVSDRPMHVDFLRVEPGSEVTVEVPVHFVNDTQAPGIRRGGVLNVVRHRVGVICKVEAIPAHIVADLTGLEIGDSLHISKIALPQGVRPAITGRDFTVATIAAAAGVKEEMRAAAEAAAAKAAAEAAVAGGAEGAAAPAEPAGEAKAAGAKPEAGKGDAGKKPEAGKKG